MHLRLFLSSRRAPRFGLSSIRAWFVVLLTGAALLLAACGGGSGGGISFVGVGPGITPPDTPAVQPPSGFSYAMTSAVYQLGQPIVPNRPSASGGTIERYTVEPALPAGLAIDRTTGIISGTPTVLVASAVYTVTAGNAGGTATARVVIEVRQTPAAPAGLSYRDLAPVYTVGQGIVPNAPNSGGGPITVYGVAPALPAGLLLDAATGVISGTPTTTAAAADYLITGTNAAGSATVTLRLTVQPALAAPASVSYDTPAALYVTTEPIAPNAAQVTGGPASSFTIAPALPVGLSINSETGVITGTPGAIQSQATYTVTASNAAGSAQTQLKISVTARGSWSAAAPIPLARHYSAAVKLNDGKVLVVGGISAGGSYASQADLYDPTHDTWTTAAPMLAARADPSATVLADGRVLVVGGDSSINSNLASAELYDPAANTWTAAGSMSVERTRHSATLLPDGRVLVIGGYKKGGSTQFLQTAEFYDPLSGSWSLAATPMSVPRAQHGAQLVAGGNAVLLIGGVGVVGSITQLTSAELFPVSGSGSPTTVAGAVPAGNVYVSALLADGSVLALADTSTTALRFAPAGTTFTTSTIASSERRILPTMTVLADGRVLVAGGVGLGTAEIYNPDVDTWTAAASMSTTRARATAVLLNDGSVLAIAGDAGAGSELSSVERYTP